MKSQRLKNFLLLALFMMGAVSISGQTDVTDTYLKNPSFEDNFTSWTNDGLVTQSNTSFTKKEGSIYIEKWVSTGSHVGDASVSQTVTTLDNGVYKLTVAAQNIQQNSVSVQTGAYIFADDNEVSVGAANDYSVTFTVIDGEVTIGFKSVGATGNWISCDNFRLYLVNQDVSAILSELQNRIDIAKGLVGQKMQTSLLNQLNVAIADAEKEVEAGTGGNVVAVAKALRIAIDASEISVKSYAELQAVVDEAEEAYGDGELNGADSFNEAIQKAKSTVEAEESTSEDLALAVVDLQQALLAFRILNASGEIPEVVTNSFIARGSTMMFGRSSVKIPSGTKIIEQGFCWSTNPEPAILDNRTTEYLNNNGHIYIMRNVQPSTVYYVRAYAMTENYAVGYGDVIKVITIPSGGITFTYDYGAPADANKRIVNALTSAVEYWNNLTSIKGLNISCHYGSGTLTADCSYGGWMRVGPNASYQRTGTILHEMGHAVGVGTHSIWNASDSPMRSNGGRGNWLGDRTTQVLRFWDNNPTEMLQGDATHMWPYGINGANEDTGSESLYIANGLITQALGEDGLPPTGGFCTPAYVLEQENDKKYYIKTESEEYGRNTAYLVISGTTLKMQEMSAEEAKNNDNAAWYITFDPNTCYYQLRNVATGRYITYSSSAFKTVAKDEPASTENFHLMRSRVDALSDNNGFSVRGYWIIHPEKVLNPTGCLSATSYNRIKKETFDLDNSATSQRWLILDADDLGKFEDTVIKDLKDNVSGLLDDYKKLLEVPHTEIEEGVNQVFSEKIQNVETQLGEDGISVVDIETISSDLRTSAMDFLGKVTVTDENNPFDLTFLMADPSLSTAEGWSGKPTISFSCAEYYEVGYDFNQVMDDMPAGLYRFTGQAFQRPGKGTDVYNAYIKGTDNVKAYIYAGDSIALLKNIAAEAQDKKLGGDEYAVGSGLNIKYMPNNPEAASLYFAKGLYQNEVVTELSSRRSLKVGIKSSLTDSYCWTVFDNFHLYYYGDAQTVAVSEIKNSSENLNVDVYTLTGMRLKSGVKVENALDGLSKGIYIVNGQKVRK